MNIEPTKHAEKRAREAADFIAVAEWQATQDGKYPQYVGAFNGWVLCTVTRNVTTKMGLAFTAGEITICNPRRFANKGAYTVWSTRNVAMTSVPASAVRVHP